MAVIQQQGAEGEHAFMEWLNQEQICYLHVDQSIQSYSPAFSHAVKRPDFLILQPQVGFIAVDVKHKTPYNQHFSIDIKNELLKAVNFETQTKLYLWYAYKIKDKPNDKRWYFISAHTAIQKGERRTQRRDQSTFLSVPMKDFIQISQANHFQKLWGAHLGNMGIFTTALEAYFMQPRKTTPQH